MAAISGQQMESLLSSFDQIYEDFKNGMKEIESLKSNCNLEIERRETLEFTCNSLKQENLRLTKLYTESLNNLADQLERRTKCQSLIDELKRVNDENQTKEDEHRKALGSLEQDHKLKLGELGDQISDLLREKAANEAAISHLRQDLSAHKSHIQALANRLDQVHHDGESKYNLEIQDLRDCLMLEQEEKNELNKKLKDLQKELLLSRTKLVEQQRNVASNRQVEILKQKLMKVRKENEILKRKLSNSEDGNEDY